MSKLFFIVHHSYQRVSSVFRHIHIHAWLQKENDNDTTKRSKKRAVALSIHKMQATHQYALSTEMIDYGCIVWNESLMSIYGFVSDKTTLKDYSQGYNMKYMKHSFKGSCLNTTRQDTIITQMCL